MDIRSYEMFLKLAETRHFGRTASHCNLSASAVSRQLKRLEVAVGQRLVDRDNRQVKLTAAGRRFAEFAQKAIEDWQQLRSDLQASQAVLTGEVSVFGSVTASYSMLTRILPVMRESYPGVEIKLRTGDQADGIQHVLAGVEDTAIIAVPDNLPRRMRCLPLRETPLRLIGPKTPSTLARQLDALLADQVEPDWTRLPMVVAERGLARERLFERLRDRGQRPHIYAQVAGHEAVVSMVSLGFGVAVVPELVIHHSPKQDTIRELPWFGDLEPFALGLCALEERLRDPLLQALWRCAAISYPQSSNGDNPSARRLSG